MTLQRPLIHIGYVKTGSTWLQKHVTSHADQGFAEILTRRTITHALTKPYVLEYAQESVAAEAASLGRNCEMQNLTPVVTHERLSGNPVSGGVDATILADRLLRLFPHGRILIVIREQKPHLRSIYNEYVNDGGPCSMSSFFFPPDGTNATSNGTTSRWSPGIVMRPPTALRKAIRISTWAISATKCSWYGESGK